MTVQNSIPVEKLIGWYNERANEINSRKKTLDTVKEVGNPAEADVEFAQGIIRGQEESALSFRAFLEVEVAEVSGSMALAESGILPSSIFTEET